jgi:hypothetical protein
MAMLASGSVQEAQDLALVAHAATLRTRVPFAHFFDGFRTSHEIATIDLVDDEVVRSMIDDDLVIAHRLRGLDPNRPVLRGTAQNPDVFFQAREAANPFHDAVPGAVRSEMERFAQLTGRHYRLFDYYGAPDAERVVVLMGSGAGTVRDAVEARAAAGEKVGAVAVRLYRPFDVATFDAALHVLDALSRIRVRVCVDRLNQLLRVGSRPDYTGAHSSPWHGHEPEVTAERGLKRTRAAWRNVWLRSEPVRSFPANPTSPSRSCGRVSLEARPCRTRARVINSNCRGSAPGMGRATRNSFAVTTCEQLHLAQQRYNGSSRNSRIRSDLVLGVHVRHRGCLGIRAFAGYGPGVRSPDGRLSDS